MAAGVLTYNLEDSLTAVALLVSTNESEQFADFMTLCFDVKFTDDCEELIVKDITDYTDVITANLTMTATVTKKQCNSLDIVVVAATPFTPGSSVMFGEADGISGDGEYCVTINSSYVVSLVTYTNETEICKTLNCCASKITTLINSIKCKMAQVGCRIKMNLNMGKKVTNFQTQLYQLVLMLNLLENCCVGCEDYESILCAFNGLKNVNC